MKFTTVDNDDVWKLFFAIWPRCVGEREYRFLEWIERKVTISSHLNKSIEYRARTDSLVCILFGHKFHTLKGSTIIHYTCTRCPYRCTVPY